MKASDLTLGKVAELVAANPKAAMVTPIGIWDARVGDIIFWSSRWREVRTRCGTYRMKDNVRLMLCEVAENARPYEYFIPYGATVLKLLKD